MNPTVAQLLAYQKTDLEAEQAERIIKNSIERKNAAVAKQTYEIANENRKKLALAMQKFNEQAAEILQKCSEMEKSIQNISSKASEPSEETLAELQARVSQLSAQTGNLEKELAKLYKKAAETGDKLQEMIALAQKSKDDFAQHKQDYEQKLESAMPAINAAREKRDQAASALPPDLLAKYQRLRDNKIVPCAKLEGSKCGGCNMELPSALKTRAASGQGFVECENCGRLIYTE